MSLINMPEQGMNLKWLHYFQLESKLLVKDVFI